MLSKLLLASAFAAIAAAQSKVLNFTAVPAPFTDGQAYALTYATNDTNSVRGSPDILSGRTCSKTR